MNEEFERLKKTLIEEGKLGRISGKVVKNFNDITENDGVTRPSGSVKDKETRDYFLELLKSYGLDIFIDKFGNIFGTLKGNSDEYIFVGSHLDSVIEGGMFDGAMGVFGGLEAIKRIKDSGYKNKKNITIVAFTGEEGSLKFFTTLPLIRPSLPSSINFILNKNSIWQHHMLSCCMLQDCIIIGILKGIPHMRASFTSLA